MAQGLTARVVGIAGEDPLFARIRQEAEEAVRREPELALFLAVNVLNHDTLEGAVSHRVASRLDHRDLPAALIRQTFDEAIARDPSIGEAFHADIMAVADRDPACLQDDRAAALFQRLPGASGLSPVPLAPEGGQARFRA